MIRQAISPLLKPYAVFVNGEIYSQHKKRLDGESAYMRAKKQFASSKVMLMDSIDFDKDGQVLRATRSYQNVIMRNWFVEVTA